MTALPNPEDFSELAPGWTAARKLQFLDHLAQHGNVRAACARVGLSREAAYRLRRRDEKFARGWGAAMVLAHDAGKEFLATCATEGIEEQIWYRGELVGTRRRIDARLLLAHMARLDAAAANPAAQRDAGRFDELLALIAGERAPEDLLDEPEDILPVEPETAARRAAYAAELALGELDVDDALAAEDYTRAHWQGRREGLARWHGWRAGACSRVDDALAAGGAEFSPRTVSDVSTAALAAGLSNCSPRAHDSPAQVGDRPGSATGERT